MKKTNLNRTRWQYLLLIAAGIFISANLFAEKIDLNNGHETQWEITDNTYSGLHFVNTIGDLSFLNLKTDHGAFTELLMNGFGQSMSIGDPKLPVLKQLIEIPLNAQVEINIINQDYTDYYLSDFGINNKLFPTQAPVSKDEEAEAEFVLNQSTYQIDEFIAGDLVKVVELGMMRGVKMARLEVSPLQYNPVQNTIRLYHSMEFNVDFVGGNTSATKDMKNKYFSPYFESTYKLLSNYKSIESDELIMDEPVTYIIVSDPMFQAALQPFIQWKTKKGFYVIEAYTDDPVVGTTTTSIQSYLQGIYNSPPAGYNPQSFVLIVGDIAQVPTFNGSAGSHVSDLYYCEYTGDIYPECFYGRFSATNLAELQPQIDKTLEYEQYLMPDPSFLDEVVMVAGADASHSSTWGNGQINYGTTYYFNLAHGLTSHTYLQPEPGGANYSQSIRDDISNGVSYANYTAHCSPPGWADPSFVMSHIPALTNDHKYPLMVGNCCSSVEFQTDCFGEEILRAANKGALGYIGGSNSTYWDEDFWWGVGFEAISANPTYNPANLGAYDRTFHENGEILSEWFVTQGQMPSAGNLAVTQAGSSREDYYWEIYHLMGDPSLMVYFSQPPVTTAVYDPLMPLSTTSFTVNTDPYAYVSITKDGILYGAAIADASGLATVTLDPITVPGSADVVVTRQNGQPFIGTVVVASPSGPYVLLDDFQIDDAAGNNNGQIDYAENILLDVTLENVGSSTANNVSAILSTTDTYVTITDDSQAWPAIPSSATSSQIGAFAFTVADDAPDQHMVTFDLTITGTSDDTWNSVINVTINAPILEPGYMTIDDASGNGNGMLDPGETVGVTIQTENNGNSISPSAMGTLTSTSPYITINTGSSNIGTIGIGAIETATFNITCDAATPVGTSVDLVFDVTAGNYGFSHTFYRSVGLIIEDWETGDFSKFPWIFAGDADWLLTTSDTYEGVYSAQSGDIEDYEISELIVTLETTTDDYISFYRKVSSESGYDYLQFWVDGNMLDEWSDEVPWGQVQYMITAGVHTFKWVYDKDVSLSNGSDCGWIDYIIFPPLAPIEPDISVSPPSINFGDVIIGLTVTEIITISNNGSDNLTGTLETNAPFSVSDVSENANYKTGGKNTLSFVVNPGVSTDYYVTFTPTSAVCYADNVTINSNDPDTPVEFVGLSGCGIDGPNMVASPGSFSKTLPPGGTTADILNIENNGGMQLDFTAQVVYSGDSKNTVTVYPQSADFWTGSCTSTNKTETSLVNALPPDQAGWMTFDVSSIPVGAVINSIEFYGYVYSTNYPYWSMTPVSSDPVTTDPATLHADIIAEASTGYYLYQNESSSYAPGWKTHILDPIANTDLEAALVQGWFATGIASRDYSSTYFIYFEGWNETNVPYLVIDYSYIPPYTWLTIDGSNSTSGSVQPTNSQNVNLAFDATGLTEGVYNADILINSNDPDMPLTNIPVTLTVGVKVT